MKNTDYNLRPQGSRQRSGGADMSVTRRQNAMGLAGQAGREASAYSKNVGGTNEQGRKMQGGMDRLVNKPKREHQD